MVYKVQQIRFLPTRDPVLHPQGTVYGAGGPDLKQGESLSDQIEVAQRWGQDEGSFYYPQAELEVEPNTITAQPAEVGRDFFSLKVKCQNINSGRPDING